MSWAVLLLSLTSLCTYSAAQVSLTQPVSESVKLGETVRISCTLSGYSISDRAVHWFQQKAGNRPRYLLWFNSDSSKHQGDGVPDRFSGSKDSPNNVGYLTIKGALLEDDADYYCAIWYSSSLHIFGGGTQLTVLTGDVKAPSVSIFPPSVEEIATKKATVVCSLSDFTPRGATVKWLVDGKDQTDSVQSSGLSKQSDNLYMESSYLSLTADQWLRHETYSCKVSHQGKEIIQTLKRSECV
uniref:LOC594871 protein n=1 Tax=Xenopus laevis TaxID=8355 RepID=Q63ZL4_XENLA|nr:LOC594871 protein [Xenopus laevis]